MAKDVAILLIEDNSFDADLTLRALKVNNLNKNYLHISDGREALDFLLAQGTYAHRKGMANPEVVLLDLDLPRMHGTEILKKMRENEPTRLIPVVVLTASDNDPVIKECYALGANSFIVKPIDSVKFYKAISDIATYWLLQNKSSPA